MQRQNSSNHMNSNNLTGVKYFIVTSMLTITFGLWVLFARETMSTRDTKIEASIGLPTEPPSGLSLVLPPIPTLIPSVTRDQSTVSPQPIYSNQPAPLRQIIYPTPNSMLQQPSNSFQGSNNPITTTGSSK